MTISYYIKDLPLFSIEIRFSPVGAIAGSSRIFSSLKMELLWDIFECIRMNKKFWRHEECIIRRLTVGEGRGGCMLAGVWQIIAGGEATFQGELVRPLIKIYT